MTEKVYLGLGSNIGDREKNIFSAIDLLTTIDGFRINQTASIYETKPLYNPDQPKFLNTAVKGKTSLRPQKLLSELQGIEKHLGRGTARIKNAPREIDIDILAFEFSVVSNGELKVPHSGLSERLFALIPFAELAPNFVIPKLNLTPVELIKTCPDESHPKRLTMEKTA